MSEYSVEQTEAIYQKVRDRLNLLATEITGMDGQKARLRASTVARECAAELKKEFGDGAIEIAIQLPDQIDVPQSFWLFFR